VESFFTELETLGVLENTLVAVTSDHGIQLRPGSVSARGPREEGVRVPFILKGPGVPEGPLSIRSRVSTIDLMPTVLDLLNIPAPPGLTGRSLKPLFEAGGSLPERPVFSLLTDSIAVWFDDYKYRVTLMGMTTLLESGADLEGPPLEEEFLHRLAPEGKGDDENIAAKRRDMLARGRKILVDTWNALDSSSARGPANQALVGFFKKAGYMK
jgi:arylsulfatase A-like enzyme